MFTKLIATAFIGTVISLAPCLVVSSNASEEVFTNISGKWRGKGLVRSTSKGKKESIRCRMSNKLQSAKHVKLSGSCAVGGFVFSLNGYIKQTGKNSYTASMFRSLANIKQSNFSGTRNGKRIRFIFKGRDRVSKKDIEATINLNSKNPKMFNIQVSRTDPENGKVFDVGTINFSKR